MKTVIDTTKFDKALSMLVKRVIELENLVLELQTNAFYNELLKEAKKMRGGEKNDE